MLRLKEISPSSASQESIPESWPRVLFSLMVAVSAAIWWSPLKSLFSLASSDDQYTHILLILPLSAALIFADWECGQVPRKERELSESGSCSERKSLTKSAVLACVTLIVAAGINLLVQQSMNFTSGERLAASILALVSCWIVWFAVCFGARSFRRALFPLFLMFGMVPLPAFALDWVVSFLQHGSAAAAFWFFRISGIPVAQRNLLLHIPGLTLAVAPECSSIRSSSFLLVTTAAFADLLLRSPWKKILAVTAAIPLSVAKNGLRIFVLGVLATRVDPGFMSGRLHRQGGIIFFLIALAAIMLLLWMMRRAESSQAKAEPKR